VRCLGRQIINVPTPVCVFCGKQNVSAFLVTEPEPTQWVSFLAYHFSIEYVWPLCLASLLGRNHQLAIAGLVEAAESVNALGSAMWLAFAPLLDREGFRRRIYVKPSESPETHRDFFVIQGRLVSRMMDYPRTQCSLLVAQLSALIENAPSISALHSFFSSVVVPVRVDLSVLGTLILRLICDVTCMSSIHSLRV
jgi:hypothetical protein